MAEHIGGRIRIWRRRRELSQSALAGLAGISQGYLSQLENGLRSVEKRSTLVALARALDVSVADLLGQSSDPTDPVRVRASKAVAGIRVALVALDVGEIEPPSRSCEEVAAAVEDAVRLRLTSDYLTLAPLLPRLLHDAAAYPGTDALTRVAYDASVVLRNLGYRTCRGRRRRSRSGHLESWGIRRGSVPPTLSMHSRCRWRPQHRRAESGRVA